MYLILIVCEEMSEGKRLKAFVESLYLALGEMKIAAVEENSGS